MRALRRILLISLALLPVEASAQDLDPAGQELVTKIKRCWMPPAREGEIRYSPRIRVSLLPDGHLRDEPEILNPPEADGDLTALAETARRAVVRCAPFEGLEAYAPYAAWETVIVTFHADF